MGISGDANNSFSFHRQYTQGGTDLWRFYRFMEDFCLFLAEPQFQGKSFCFTMDNLNVHKHPIILNMIHENGHRIVFRAPYWSCDGAIEYVFNVIHTKLQQDFNSVDNIDELQNAINIIIGNMDSFYDYFLYVGFVW